MVISLGVEASGQMNSGKFTGIDDVLERNIMVNNLIGDITGAGGKSLLVIHLFILGSPRIVAEGLTTVGVMDHAQLLAATVGIHPLQISLDGQFCLAAHESQQPKGYVQ